MPGLPDLGPKYVLERPLARGGPTQVFLGKHVGPGGFSRPVVIKTVTPDLSGDEAAGRTIELLRQEAGIAALVSHPNLVHLLDYGEHLGTHYLVFEHLQGRTLDQVVKAAAARGQALPPAFVATVAARVCAALGYLHSLRDAQGRSLGLVHRDVSTVSIAVCPDGAIRLLDLGVAQLDRARAEKGLVKGRAPYLSPEQCVAKELDGRSDLFSLGVVLWELVARRRLVAGEDLQQVATTITRVRAPLVRTVDPDFPEALAEAIGRALEIEPENRFANAAELARPFEEFLATIQQGLPPLPQPVPGESSGEEEVSPVVSAALADLARLSATTKAPDEALELADPSRVSAPPPPGLPFRPAVGIEEPIARAPVAGAAEVVRIPDAEEVARRNRRRLLAVGGAVLALVVAVVGWKVAFSGASADELPVFDKRFRVTSDPEGAKVTLDGREVGTTPYRAATPLPPGDHRLELVREGFAVASRTVNGAAGSDVFVTLEPVHLRTRAPTPGVEAPAPKPQPAIIITYPDAGD
ncbi:MAG: serine/threonine-protein kinase [Myxococcales bacterium]